MKFFDTPANKKISLGTIGLGFSASMLLVNFYQESNSGILLAAAFLLLVSGQYLTVSGMQENEAHMIDPNIPARPADSIFSLIGRC